MTTIRPRVQKARVGLLRRLSQMDVQGKVLTIYVDLDPTQFATAGARESEVKSLTNEAEALVEQLDEDSKKSLRDDVRRVREFLLGNDDWTSEARSVAIFASSQNGLFNVVKVPEPLPRGVFVDRDPHVLPLREIVEQDKWCVVLVDRRNARIFTGTPVSLKEYDQMEDAVHGQHDQGGWSQARYERSVEEGVEDHLKNVSERLRRLHESRDFDHFVIATHDELWPRLSERLHPYVGERVAGRIDVDVQMAEPAELEEKLKGLQSEIQKEREKALLEQLSRGLANDSRAASGLPRVLECLNEARVDTLLITQDADASGAVCPKCGYLSLKPGKCPADGESMEEVSSIIDQAIERAEETSADSVILSVSSALPSGKPVAALLRY
jgi:peptide chain release factor subunit 1